MAKLQIYKLARKGDELYKIMARKNTLVLKEDVIHVVFAEVQCNEDFINRYIYDFVKFSDKEIITVKEIREHIQQQYDYLEEHLKKSGKIRKFEMNAQKSAVKVLNFLKKQQDDLFVVEL